MTIAVCAQERLAKRTPHFKEESDEDFAARPVLWTLNTDGF
jgi:hypothetical protein